MEEIRRIMVEVTVVSVFKGIITLIENDGSIGVYRQRGIKSLGVDTLQNEINSGRLSVSTLCVEDLPYEYKLVVEDEDIQGEASSLIDYKVGVD